MIKFFRKIRQNLLLEGKTTKYFKYAVGEIVLVVVGILIALQINNWDESRIQDKQELKLLQQLRADLYGNENELQILIKKVRVNSWAMDSLLVRLNEKNYDKSISVYTALIHRKSFFNNSNSGYKLLGNGMAKIISNDSLLNGILSLYEKDFANIKTRENIMNNKIENKLYPLTNQLFKINPNLSIRLKEFDVVATEVYSPINYELLSVNHEYINNLLQLNNTFKTRRSYLKITEKRLAKVLKILDTELNKH